MTLASFLNWLEGYQKEVARLQKHKINIHNQHLKGLQSSTGRYEKLNDLEGCKKGNRQGETLRADPPSNPAT